MTATLSVKFETTGAKPTAHIPFPIFVLAYEGDEKLRFSASAEAVDAILEGGLSRAVLEADFKAKLGNSLVVRSGRGTAVLIGGGKATESGLGVQRDAEVLGGHVFGAMGEAGLKAASLYLDPPPSGGASGGDASVAHHVGHGAYLASYVFKDYFTKGEAAEVKEKTLTIMTADAQAEALFAAEAELAAGVFLARDLITEPANKLYPESYAQRCQDLGDALGETGFKVKVLDEAAMVKEGMHLLLSVGQGSRRASRTVVMEWPGAGLKGAKLKDAELKDAGVKSGAKDQSPIVLIGKGVCFDSGGISIKPAGGMEDMKWDMGGSAAVVGAMRALAGRRVKRNVIGLIGLVENMPDGAATRPGDVITSMSGQTVEIINTDAEGRLVLADLLTYAQTHYKPAKIIDLATLTGAILIALGKEYAGLFSNDDDLAQAILAAGVACDEPSWRLPMGKAYDEMLKSHIADMKNVGGRLAGSITAACFLSRFVDDVPWAHLDIAGKAWADKAAPTVPKGGTGYGVKMLTRLVESE